MSAASNGAGSDPCDGLDYAGQCSGSVLEWCESGSPRSYDCAQAGLACGYQDPTVGYNCVGVAPAPAPTPAATNDCASLGYAGRCDANTLVWCEGGSVRSYDCAAVGMTCGYQNDAIGNNCLYYQALRATLGGDGEGDLPNKNAGKVTSLADEPLAATDDVHATGHSCATARSGEVAPVWLLIAALFLRRRRAT